MAGSFFLVWFLDLFLVVPMFAVVPLSNSGQGSRTSSAHPTSNNRRRRRKLAKQRRETQLSSSAEFSLGVIEPVMSSARG